jgi:NAD(P)-dependent dehydrogenase (short-subunit alcohol dehydrogenase family)
MTSQRLKDKIAIVTGGGSGIGRATCQLFAAEGANVVVSDRFVDRAKETVDLIAKDGGTAIAVEADVTNAAQIEAMTARALGDYERIDILVNNAGISKGDDILTIDEATWDLNLAVVLKGAFLCSKAVLPAMIEQGSGAIVNIASVNGIWAVGEEAYSAAKAGMINLTQNMAIKYGRHGVRINCIAPGSIRTPIWGDRIAEDPHIFDDLAKWYPLGRVGEPEDVAKAVAFIASDDATWITGVTLPVDGGLLAGGFGMAQALQGEETTRLERE